MKILPSLDNGMNLTGSHKSSCLEESRKKLQFSSYRGIGYRGLGSEAGLSCPNMGLVPNPATRIKKKLSRLKRTNCRHLPALAFQRLLFVLCPGIVNGTAKYQAPRPPTAPRPHLNIAV